MPARQRGPGLRGWPGSAAAFRSSRARRLQRPTALALPLREAPEVAAYAARVDLATREGHVRVADEPLLGPGERIHFASTSSESGRRLCEIAPVRSGNSTQYSLRR